MTCSGSRTWEAFEALIKRYNPGYRREYLVRDWSRITDRLARLEMRVRRGAPRAGVHRRWGRLAHGLETLEESIKRGNPLYRRRFALYDWRPLLGKWGYFRPAELHSFPYTMPSNAEHFTGYAFTLPFVRNEVSPGGQERFREDLAALLREHHGDRPFDVHFTTKLYVAERA